MTRLFSNVLHRTYRLMLMALLGAGSAVAQQTGPAAGLQPVASGFVHPVVLAEPPDDSGRLFIGDQTGQIWIVKPDGTRPGEPFLDLSARLVDLNEGYDERGLLGLAFHPDYATNGRFFVYYSAPLRPEAPEAWNHTSHVSEFTVSAGDPDRADAGSERIVLQIDQPQSNHNAGTLAFGPADGYLYISLGDGGGRDDEGTGHVDDWYDGNAGGNGQDLAQNLLGSILRIDVDGGEAGQPYGIPADNPFVGLAGVPAEQFAYGFRNPYRFSFDPGGTHDLIVGDAGQELWEEVSRVSAGGNYGWNVKEGAHCFDAANPEQPPATCPTVVGAGHPLQGQPLIDPVIEVPNAKQEGGLGLVVVGGHVYRGTAIPGLDGRYIFGVASRGRQHVDGREVHLPGRILSADPQPVGMWPYSELRLVNVDSLEHLVLSFGQDRSGELYVLVADSIGPSGQSGQVLRFVSPSEDLDRESDAELPNRIVLEQNYPNPFNPSTTIRFEVERPMPVALAVYDATGQAVVRLMDGPVAAGRHRVQWDGRDAQGHPLPSGTYFYRLETPDGTVTRALSLIR